MPDLCPKMPDVGHFNFGSYQIMDWEKMKGGILLDGWFTGEQMNKASLAHALRVVT
jgi:hypothetical protein